MVGVLMKTGNNSIQLVDAITKRQLYTLHKTGMFKSDWVLKDPNGEEFAKCLPAMFNKRKIRFVMSFSISTYMVD